MRELKRQKESLAHQQQRVAPPPGLEQMGQLESMTSHPGSLRVYHLATSTSNSHSKPTKKGPKKIGEIINGHITENIPEGFAICLGSPSHNERVRKFREMFNEERVAIAE